ARHARVGVSHGYGDNPAEEIQVLVALHVPQVLHAGVVSDQWIRIISGDRREKILLVLFHDLVFSHGCSVGIRRLYDLAEGWEQKNKAFQPMVFVAPALLPVSKSCGAQAPSPAYCIELLNLCKGRIDEPVPAG